MESFSLSLLSSNTGGDKGVWGEVSENANTPISDCSLFSSRGNMQYKSQDFIKIICKWN